MFKRTAVVCSMINGHVAEEEEEYNATHCGAVCCSRNGNANRNGNGGERKVGDDAQGPIYCYFVS